MSNAGPQFPTHEEMGAHSLIGHVPTAGKGGIDKTGRFVAKYKAYHLDPSGGINHSGEFHSPEEAHKWASTAATAGSGSHADSHGGSHGMLSGYRIDRRVDDTHHGTNTGTSEFDSGHISVFPLKAGAKPETRNVTSQRVPGMDHEKFRQDSATRWRGQMENESKKRQSAAKGK